MKEQKIKLTEEQIIELFTSKPVFDKSETESSILYGWSSTKGGLYNITDIYKYFEEKGYEIKYVDDCIEKFFQKESAFQIPSKMEKGKTHNLFLLNVFNHNPDYKTNFPYYFYDLTREEATKLKLEYEAESLTLMQALIEKRKNATKNYSASKKAKEEKKTKKASKPKVDKPKVERKPRTKKIAITESITI